MSKQKKGNREAKKPKKKSDGAKEQNIDSKKNDEVVARIAKGSGKTNKE